MFEIKANQIVNNSRLSGTSLVYQRIIHDPLTVVEPGQIFTQSEIDKDKYLITAYYHKASEIRVVTPNLLIGDIRDSEGSSYAKPEPDKDLSLYAYQHIMEQGRTLLFIEPGSKYGILKPVNDKKFLDFGLARNIPFGLTNFIQPKPNLMNITQPFTYNKPIIIVEGLRDCLDLQTVYPYVLAMRTAGIPSFTKEIIKTLTTNLILAFDDDESGDKAFTQISRSLSGFSIKKLSHSKYKDAGYLSELYHNKFEYEFLRSFYLMSISSLIG